MFRACKCASWESTNRWLTLIIFLLIAPANSLAGDMQYACIITGVKSLQNGGVETVQGSQFKIYRGSTIYIDRRSGEITGPYMLDVKIAEHVIKILDKGDSGNSFKALAVAGRHVYYIEVIEYDAASKKSFVIYNNKTLWHGLCV